jgi:hypothetical protein
MKQKQVYALDLTRIGGNGDFSCPQCGAKISPDDFYEETYSIQEVKVEDGSTKELVIRCNRCAGEIHLTGFSLLKELKEKE